MKEGDGDDQSREYPCIVRVTDGEKAKFSTKVHSMYFVTVNYTHDVRFYQQISTNFTPHMALY